jgi:hypothetical protein
MWWLFLANNDEALSVVVYSIISMLSSDEAAVVHRAASSFLFPAKLILVK